MPDSREKLICENVRTGLCLGPLFQGFVGAEDAAEAAARVWIEAVDRSGYARPGAVVRLHDAGYGRETISGWNLWPEGVVQIVFHASPAVGEEGFDLEAFMGDFIEEIRQIKWEFLELSVGPQRVQFKRCVELEGPWMEQEESERLLTLGTGACPLYWGWRLELEGQ